MIKNVLFIQPFVLENEHLTNEILIWYVYLENFLKSRFSNLEFDLLYLPIEKNLNKLRINSFQDFNNFSLQMEDLCNKIKFELDSNTIICISGTTSHHFLSSKLIADFLQKYFPSSIIIFGGAHASAKPLDFNYQGSPIDYIIMGEGEIPLYNLINKNLKKQKIPIVISNNPVPSLNDLPLLDLSILDKYIKYFNHLSISLSRGCPFNCNFCMERNLTPTTNKIKRWRTYTPSRAIEEVKSMIKYGEKNNIKEYGFYDPIFGLNRTWLKKFLEKFHFPEMSYAWIETRLDVLNEELIKEFHIKRFHLMYGLESYSKKMLSIMNKTHNPTEYLNKFEKIFEIHKKFENIFALNILCNHPGETKNTYNETFKRLENIVLNDYSNSVYLNIRFYHHFPGTKLHNNFNFFEKKYGAIAYYPEWWRYEDLLKYGAYCIRPSFNLSLRESIEIYTESYKTLEKSNLYKLKEKKPPNLLKQAILIKNEINTLNQKREHLFTFLNENKIEV
ncbi:MAG: B12-binding domain-containing radical SAM protein [Promethearchaeota archaeon]